MKLLLLLIARSVVLSYVSIYGCKKLNIILATRLHFTEFALFFGNRIKPSY